MSKHSGPSHRWLGEVHINYHQAYTRRLVPSNSVSSRQAYFNCAAALMTSQLQSLVLDSMTDYTAFISCDPVRETGRETPPPVQ